jgi:hypothetical protein
VVAFEGEWIEKMANKIYKANDTIRHLFISIDPSSGKDLNFYALTSMIFVGEHNERCIVCFSKIPTLKKKTTTMKMMMVLF